MKKLFVTFGLLLSCSLYAAQFNNFTDSYLGFKIVNDSPQFSNVIVAAHGNAILDPNQHRHIKNVGKSSINNITGLQLDYGWGVNFDKFYIGLNAFANLFADQSKDYTINSTDNNVRPITATGTIDYGSYNYGVAIQPGLILIPHKLLIYASAGLRWQPFSLKVKGNYDRSALINLNTSSHKNFNDMGTQLGAGIKYFMGYDMLVNLNYLVTNYSSKAQHTVGQVAAPILTGDQLEAGMQAQLKSIQTVSIGVDYYF